jgi:hypothetical protein
MTQNFTDEKKEYLRIASRFLKEVGLYDLWIKYCYNTKTSKSWAYEKCRDATDILGKTSFTRWVRDHSSNPELLHILEDGICVYELLGEYLFKVDGKVCYWQDYLDVDIEKKKVTLK